jgi:hypothetical protein
MSRPHAPTNRVQFLLVALLLVAVLAFLAACKSGGGGGDKATPTPAPDEATPADGGGGGFEEQTFSINQEFWHSGFHVTLNDGETSTRETPDGRPLYFVSIDATFENLGPQEDRFFGQIALVQDGTAFIEAGDDTDIPFVPAGLSSNGTLAYIVEENFDPDRAQVVVGTPEENQAIIPLGPQGGELVTLEPSAPPFSGEISMELIDLTFTGAELRADVPAGYREIEAGKRGLTLNFDATSRKSGNWLINPQDFALVLPSGSGVGVDDSMLASLPGSDAGTETSDLYVTFLVDDPPAGDYTLRFSPGSYWVGEDGVTEATLEFSLT